jgi:hypothetical protein
MTFRLPIALLISSLTALSALAAENAPTALDAVRTEKLVTEIERIKNRYAMVLKLELVREGREFFASELLDPSRKFAFVAALPESCMLDDWRPWHETSPFSHIACADGKTTWVREDVFAPLKARQKAFVLLNARLNYFSPSVSKQTTRDLFWSLDLAFGVIHGYRPEDLPAANRLTSLLDVYLGARQTYRYDFSSDGTWQRVER